MSANAQKTAINSLTPNYTPLETQFLDCKRAYIKLSMERDTLKKMLVDTVANAKREREAFKTEKQKRFWKGVKRGVVGTLSVQGLVGLYFGLRAIVR